ncbi:MAG: hypothetical protein PHD07_04805 [Bacteroidales bacterium]|nr:hypothetical protein [Bacteroidales bacterium]
MKDVIYIYERGRNKRICFNDFLIAKYLHTELGYTNVRIDGKRYWYNDSIQGHIDSIRKQRVSSIFYLPSSTDMEESMVLMDHITHYDNKLIDPKIFCQNKIFTLGQFGLYMFLIKNPYTSQEFKKKLTEQASKTGQIRDSNSLKNHKKQQITKI